MTKESHRMEEKQVIKISGYIQTNKKNKRSEEQIYIPVDKK